jgi:dihydroflavonol-4-reductase
MTTPRSLLVTGATGFIAKHIVLQALNAGHTVTASVRALSRGDEVQAAIAPHLTDPAHLGRLRFVPLDLTQDAGWPEALAGQDALIHTASPFPIDEPQDPEDVIRPARDGTRRALTAAAAAGVRRVVLTSSCAAIWEQIRAPAIATEADWSDPDTPGMQAYSRSKTIAEREAWRIAGARGLALTTINPSVVLGPPLDAHYGSSVSLIARLLSGRDALTVDAAYGVVDVRDVACLHLAAIDHPDSAGERFIANAGTLHFREMGQIAKAAHPERRAPTRVAPSWLVRLIARVDPGMRSALPHLGVHVLASNAKATRLLGHPFIAPDEALRASAEALIAMGAV